MLKLLRLLMVLSGNRRYTLAELMQRFDQSDRTIYRHLEEIESAGFVLNRTGGTYQLQTDNPAVKSLRKLLHFSEEEAYVLYKTIALLQGTSPIKDRLAGKLNALYDFRALSLLPGRNSHEAVAVGRKNYLFAGSHAAAQRSAIFYSLLATCKNYQVNPTEWMQDVLTRIAGYPINKIQELLPQNWKPTPSE
ncbi:MAG: transcriptional [Ignavibacteria bacterium]|nr:MAG: transcriptional [Ignavibacteria bacterium]